ncbi:hypothetical protein [Altericroceibacterium xinjiangense]|uniref:hypothetical protein n=1 Tax=Altericroceibacterium xinjiangense TaxID=762261 RepID=UPI000F7D5EF6|nr:hypothetical protein [Altericroceibacterium xinjiangense]
MKLVYGIVAAAGLAALGMPAAAQVNEPAPQYKVQPQVEVVNKNNRGRATAVRINGTVYQVCMTDNQDSCIQPRAAGLGFGERPLGYYPKART